MNNVFEAFNNGKLAVPGKSIAFDQIAWSKHPTFEGVELKHIIAGKGICVNDGAELIYEPGVISIIPAKVPHEVNAGGEGLYLFAKFFPALC